MEPFLGFILDFGQTTRMYLQHSSEGSTETENQGVEGSLFTVYQFVVFLN